MASKKSDILKDHLESLTKSGTWELDLVTDRLSWSDGVFKMLGYELQEFEATLEEGLEKVHPQDRERSATLLQDVIENGAEYFIEKRLETKSGSFIHVRSKATIFKDEQGRPIKLIGVFQDISDFVESEKHKLQQLLDNSLDTLCTINEHGIFQMVSKSSERLWGYKPEEMEGKVFSDFIVAEDAARSIQASKDLRAGKKVRNFRNRYRHKKGHVVPVAWSAYWEPQQRLLNCIARDATEQLQAEEQLRLSENRFKALVQEGSDLIVILDSEGRYKYISPANEGSGFEPEDYTDKSAFDFIHPQDTDWVGEEFKRIENEKNIVIPPYRFLNSMGEWRWMESHVTNLLEEPSVQGIVANSRDVTVRIETERELEKRKERFELVMKAASETIWDYDVVKDELYLGDGYLDKYGAAKFEYDNNLKLHDALVHPEDFPSFKAGVEAALKNPKIVEWEDKYRFLKQDGEYAFVKDRAVIVRDDKGKALRMVGAISDISKEYTDENLDRLEKQLMEKTIAGSESITKIVEIYLTGIEQLYNNINVSILSVEGEHLSNFITPSLPDGFVSAIEGLRIGLNQGSCGTSAYTKQRVLVNDVGSDERWLKFRDLAKQYEIYGCWSQPLFDSRANVVATIAIYFRHRNAIKYVQISLFDRISNLISLVIQNFNYIKNIQESNDRFNFINKATNNAIYDWDVVSDTVYWGDSLTRVFGHDTENSTLAEWTALIHPEDVDEVLQNLDIFLANQDHIKWIYSYRLKDVNGQYAYVEEVAYLIRSQKGLPLRLIGAIRDNTEIKREQIKKEIQQRISGFFKDEDSLESALRSCLKYLTEFSHFSLGEVWLTSHDESRIRMMASYAKNKNAKDFYDFDLTSEFDFAQGLPGKVWKEKKFQLWNDIDTQSDFLRQEAAKATGIQAAVAYPLYFGKKVMGVVLFAKNSIIEDSSYTISNFKILESVLGEEIKRKQQEKELEIFFESAPDILGIINQKGTFVRVNEAFCQLLGYTQQELTSQPFLNFLHPDDLESTMAEYEGVKAGGEASIDFICRFKSKRGRYKWISWSSSESYGADDFVFAYGRDVTETIELQQTITAASQMAKVGGWEIDYDLGVHYWSPITKEIHEVPEDFSVSMEAALNFYTSEYRQMVRDRIENAEKSGNSFDFEAVILTAKGKEKWIRAIGDAEIREGKCIRLYGSIQDIHDRKIAEQRLKNISDNIPGVLYQHCLNPDGTSTLDLVSGGAKSIFGFSAEECMENPDLVWKNIEKAGDLNAVNESLEKSAEHLTRWVAKWRYIMPDGSVRYHEGSGNPERKQDGTIVWDSIIVDITEKQEAEKQVQLANVALEQHARDLEISNSELEQFAYVASHDLQEPLRMISGFLTQLDKKYGDQLDEKANQYIYYAVDGAQRMRQIILDLLDFSRIGKLTEEVSEVDLNEVVEEVCLLNRKKIEELNAKIQFKNLPTILQHPSPMIQIFQNLISNGLKYNALEDKPKVVIRAKELKKVWKFSVEDNGIGIEKQYFDKIFNIFQRLHSKSEYSGTGMGLAIVKKIIENQNGRIWLESEKGKGTTFYFTLPK